MKTSSSRRSRSGVCVEEDGFGAIVGKGGLIDGLVVPLPARWVGTAVTVWFQANSQIIVD